MCRRRLPSSSTASCTRPSLYQRLPHTRAARLHRSTHRRNRWHDVDASELWRLRLPQEIAGGDINSQHAIRNNWVSYWIFLLFEKQSFNSNYTLSHFLMHNSFHNEVKTWKSHHFILLIISCNLRFGALRVADSATPLNGHWAVITVPARLPRRCNDGFLSEIDEGRSLVS